MRSQNAEDNTKRTRILEEETSKLRDREIVKVMKRRVLKLPFYVEYTEN